MKSFVAYCWKMLERIMYFVLFRVLHVPFSEGKWESFLQFIKFGIVGVSNTIVSYVIYVSFLLIFQRTEIFQNTDYLIAQFIAFLLSVLWSFYWNRKFVFKAEHGAVSWPKALLKTYISYAFTGIFLNSILSVFWIEYLNLSKMIAPIANLLLNVPLNFIMNKFWAFRKK